MLVKVYHPEGGPNASALTPKDLEELYEAARRERMFEIIGRIPRHADLFHPERRRAGPRGAGQTRLFARSRACQR